MSSRCAEINVGDPSQDILNLRLSHDVWDLICESRYITSKIQVHNVLVWYPSHGTKMCIQWEKNSGKNVG
jgi:hypothetical protein